MTRSGGLSDISGSLPFGLGSHYQLHPRLASAVERPRLARPAPSQARLGRRTASARTPSSIPGSPRPSNGLGSHAQLHPRLASAVERPRPARPAPSQARLGRRTASARTPSSIPGSPRPSNGLGSHAQLHHRLASAVERPRLARPAPSLARLGRRTASARTPSSITGSPRPSNGLGSHAQLHHWLASAVERPRLARPAPSL